MAGKRASVVSGAAYAASKFGVVSLTHSINLEQWAYGIRACAICPGEVETPILEQRPMSVPEERRRHILQPEDVAAAVVFVAVLSPRVVVPEILIEPRVRAT
jgi:NAD(P)-dependent dehydrogenase (short-subunit alcohol dehydrogenase family)